MMKKIIFTFVFVMMHATHTAEGQIIPNASYCLAIYERDRLAYYSYYTADGTLIKNVVSDDPYALLDSQAPLPKIVRCSFWRNPTPGQVKRNPLFAIQVGSIEFKDAQGRVVLSLCYRPLNGLLSGTTSHRYNKKVEVVLSDQKLLKNPTVGQQLGLDVSELDVEELNHDIANWHQDYEASDHAGVRKHRGCVVS